ncbi:hypothetical protein ACIQWR_14445 [Streptomyces sp. NPDC098789]|uniref:hypothetical protein n=1 Tax=Streptomyces sp. NPDC098789 TaxID=3366098 RepID=UPI0037FED72D
MASEERERFSISTDDALRTRRFADIDADIAATEAMPAPAGWEDNFDEAEIAAAHAGIAQALAADTKKSAV